MLLHGLMAADRRIVGGQIVTHVLDTRRALFTPLADGKMWHATPSFTLPPRNLQVNKQDVWLTRICCKVYELKIRQNHQLI